MITNIRLQNFRSYQDASFEFEDGVNVIVGPNASGKTNLLEAILMVTLGKSYRAKDGEMIRDKKPWARIDADIVSSHHVVKLEGNTNEEKTIKTFQIDDQTFSRLGVNKQIPTVLFEPNHLLMLSSSPELRRNFIDGLISQTEVGYGAVLRQYKRILAQRNRLLKEGLRTVNSQLFAWDIRLSETGAKIVAARQAIIKQINQQTSAIYSEIANTKSKLIVEYSVKTDPAIYATSFLKRLEKDKQLDILRGFTSAGPHREDLYFHLNNKLLASTASRGEARTTLLTLKVVELKIIEKQRDKKPLLLLDDVFGELDGARRKALTSFLNGYQAFITTTDADIVLKNFKHTNNVAL